MINHFFRTENLCLLLLFPRIWQFFLLLLIGISSVWLSPALAAPLKLDEYFRETWTTKEGLPHNTINSITQSTEGYMWFATWEGVVRYNGREFRLFDRSDINGLPDAGIKALGLDQQRNVIIGGLHGTLARFSDRQWQLYTQGNTLVYSILSDARHNLWIATESAGIYLIQADGNSRQLTENDGLPSNTVYSLLQADDRTIWAGTATGLVAINTDDLQVTVLSGAFSDSPVFALHKANGHHYVGTEQGLYEYQQQQFRLLSPELKDIGVSAIITDSKGALWIGTVDRGLLRLSDYGLEILGVAEGLPNNRVLSLFEDNEQNIWVGTNSGLLRLREAPFVSLTTKQGLADNFVRTVLAHSDGTVWVGSSEGVNRIKQNRVEEKIDLSAAIQGQSILSLAEGIDGGVWIGTHAYGLLYWKNGQVTEHYDRHSGLSSNDIRAILPEADGTVWIATGYGLNRLHAGSIRQYFSEDGLPSDFIISLLRAKDNTLYVGTGQGVAYFDHDTFHVLDIAHLDNASHVFGFHEQPEDGVIWMSTSRGLIRYQPATQQLRLIGRQSGIPFEKLFQVVEDNQGFFWLTTNRGMIRISGKNAHAVADEQLTQIPFEIFNDADGLFNAQANGGSNPAAIKDTDGRIWIATSGGVAFVQPEFLSDFSTTVPPVVIENMSVNGEAVKLGAESVFLKAGSNRVEFNFAGLGFVMPGHIRYRTLLKGFDSDWVIRGTQNFAEYTNLPPGEYQFQVTASYLYGNWNDTHASISFNIESFFWQHKLFWLMLMIGFIVMVLLMMKWRLAIINKTADRLRQQVAEKTAELQKQTNDLLEANREKTQLLASLKQQSEMFEQQARIDVLTGLANRRAFDEALIKASSQVRRSGLPLCLVLMDIDHFKQINDNWSHSIGDGVLQKIADALTKCCRGSDVVARWGGEEFALLLPDTVIQDGAEICERLRKLIQLLDYSDLAEDLTVTVSIGIAEYTAESRYENLLSRADIALYHAKRSGRNKVVIAEK